MSLFILVEAKLEKLDILSSKVDNIAHDVEMLKIRTSPPGERKTTPMNAIQVQINEKIRMLEKLKERCAREKDEEERELRAFLPPTSLFNFVKHPNFFINLHLDSI